jgi:nicotinate-nucleotide adenylyltransferase
MSERRLGVLGGTFDPIHYGHLRAGDAAETALTLDEIRVIPAHDPPHRTLDPKASAFHRFALCALALEGKPRWRLSDAELTRTGPSYTAHTLRALHAEGWRPSQIFFILGSDAFAEIATWYDFPAVLKSANYAVVARPGTTLQAAWERFDPAGIADPSVSEGSTGFFRVHAETPNVSSTDIRARISEGLSIDDLVPAPVARYILNHRLYVEGPPSTSAPGAAVDKEGGHYDQSAAVNDLHGKTERTHG